MDDFSPTGWLAIYEVERPNLDVPSERLVEAWHPDGHALVVDEQAGRLVAASSLTGFARLTRCRQIVAAAAAAPGWQLEVWDTDDEDSTTSLQPIAAWLVDYGGQVFPVAGADDASWLEPRLDQVVSIRAPQASPEQPERAGTSQ